MSLIVRIILIITLIVVIVRMLRRIVHKSQRATDETSTRPQSPYEILGVSKNDPPDKIRMAYKHTMSQYHPDKVAHLGPDLQKLAREKSAEINRAYKELGL